MKCPHCLDSVHPSWTEPGNFAVDPEGAWSLHHMKCPGCSKIIAKLVNSRDGVRVSENLVRPKAPSRARASSDVPSQFKSDYEEACLVLADSPKASAALSRRCLQHLLRERADVKPGSLDSEIQQVLEAKVLPVHLAQAVDAVRVVGNFAAHPIKSQSSGEVVDVEPGEAEWLLDTLEGLFDFWFVQPALLESKKQALNRKLQDAGKPPLK